MADDSCGCIYVDVDETYQTISRTEPKARKEHQCCECRRAIQPGERYERYRGKLRSQEKPDTFLTCPDCISIRNEFFCDGWPYEGLWEYVDMHVWDLDGEISSDCLLRLTPMARMGIIEIIDQVFKEREDEDGD